jgi:hypothetical protein
MSIISEMIKHSGRAWWQARYSDGKVLSEWDTLVKTVLWPVGLSKTSRWEEVPKKGMIGLRLLCPDGLAGEIEAPEGYKFFQLKVGYQNISMGGGKNGRSIGAHIIGVVSNSNGDCMCRAWDYRTKKLLQFDDNVFDFKFEHLGKLSLEVQGLRV